MTSMARMVSLLALLLGLAAGLAPARAELTARQRRQVFDIVWSRVKERHFDAKLGGVDWNAVRRRYAPKAAAARDDASFYPVLSRMLGELKQSHFAILPPAAYAAEDEETSGPADPGLTVQLVEDRAVVTDVAPGGAADEAGIRPGYEVTAIDGKPTAGILKRVRARKLRPAAERLQVFIAAHSRLTGAPGTKVSVAWVDGSGTQASAALERREPDGRPIRFGELPPIVPRFESRRLDGGIGYVRFSIFLMPVLQPIRDAIASMHDATGLVIDLRGNFGGLGAMAPGVAAAILDRQASLGVMKLRRGQVRFPVFPLPDPYRGPVVLLTDEASLSTSEVLAGGLQELGRVKVVGRQTGGMVLPSIIEKLPGGARLQYAIADFRTPGGILLEGRGVIPDIPVELTRRSLLEKGDPTLAAAVAALERAAQTDPRKAAGGAGGEE